MFRISNCKTVLHKLSLAFSLAILLPFLAKADLGITVFTTQNGNEVTADFLVDNFEQILTMQFTVEWPAADLAYVGNDSYGLPNLGAINFGTNQVSNGKLTFSWVDPSVTGVTLPSCSKIFSVRYNLLAGQIPPINIGSSVTVIEIIDGNGQNVALNQTAVCSDVGLISGNVFKDANVNCLKDGGDVSLEDWKVKFEQNGTVEYLTTNSNGDYSRYASPGSYNISLVLPQNNLWSVCQVVQVVDVVANQSVVVNLPAQVLSDCPYLNVDLSAPFLRRCIASNYYVNYCNHGTITAEDAYVEITLDADLTAISSSIPWTAVNGQTYTFPVGDVPVGQCGNFSMSVMVSCDAEFGQTHCTEAHIFPDEICEPLNPFWDGSLLDVTGTCDGDSVRFTIQNNGDDMQSPVDFIVIEDDMINFQGNPIQLEAGDSYVVSVPANGATWRVEVDNVATSPFNGDPSVSVEGCGVNGSGTFSLGFVTQFPQGSQSPFVDIDCQQNVDSYDPNDKTGYPNGYCAAHFIESATQVEYRIRFQNTGTAPAINIVVQDTLPLTLNPATVVPGASSHPYDFELLGNGVVQFTFPNIMLPDSNANEAASHGFVNFTVSQASNNTNGTLIQNEAAIHFDFNEPVYTNIFTHTVADDFIQAVNGGDSLSISGFVNTWYGEPLEGVNMTLSPVCPAVTDENGFYVNAGLGAGDYVLTPIKQNLDKQAGVTILDLLKLRQHIIGATPYEFAYQTIASELNNGSSITTFDLVIQGKMALGIPGGNDGAFWRFVDADFVFPMPAPLVNYPFSINFNGFDQSVANADFVAVKPGDVIHESMVDSSLLNPIFFFKTNPMSNGQVRVELKVNDFEQVMGFQFGLTWDADVLQFTSTEAGAIQGINVNDLVPGQLQLFAVPQQNGASTFTDSTTLFSFVFNVLSTIGSSSPLALDPMLLPFQVVVEDCKLAGATVEDATVTIETINGATDVARLGFSVNVSPNPAQVGAPIAIEIAAQTARSLTMQVFDVGGKSLGGWQQEVQAGKTSFMVQPSLAQGIYLLKITDERGEGRSMKLVVF